MNSAPLQAQASFQSVYIKSTLILQTPNEKVYVLFYHISYYILVPTSDNTQKIQKEWR
jgi:hypothetical protein